MALIQIVYVSTAREDLCEADIEAILAAATHHNAIRDVTGMLMYADGQFMQLLEGEEAAVDATFARVRQDPRHHDLTVLERSPIIRRNFSDWHMGYKRVAPNDITYVPHRGGPAAPCLAGAILSTRATDGE